MRRAWKWVAVVIVVVVAVVYAKRHIDYRARENAPPIADYRHDTEGNPICPHCGRTDKITAYSYGLRRDGSASNCVIGPNSPRYKCEACGTSFGRPRELEDIERAVEESKRKQKE
jgi:hypothetical protein